MKYLSVKLKQTIMFLGVVVSMLAIQTVFGQETGVIAYETKVNLHRNIPKEREGMKTMIPEFRTNKFQLFYNANESLYKPIIEDEEEDMVASGRGNGGGFRMRFQAPNVEIYYNQEEAVGLSSQEFNGKQYLITDSLEVAPWKFGEGTKVILGYECKMAYYVDASRTDRPQEITAWYSNKLRPFLGPDRYYSLPGAVLAIDVNNGERVTVAQSIDIRSLKKSELKMPTKGEPITQSALRKMQEEQMQKMRQQGGGRVIIGN